MKTECDRLTSSLQARNVVVKSVMKYVFAPVMHLDIQKTWYDLQL